MFDVRKIVYCERRSRCLWWLLRGGAQAFEITRMTKFAKRRRMDSLSRQHSCTFTRVFLARNVIAMFYYPLYSPDLTPCDFFFFSKYKIAMHNGAITRAKRRECRRVSRTVLIEGKRRWNKCMSTNEEYFRRRPYRCILFEIKNVVLLVHVCWRLIRRAIRLDFILHLTYYRRFSVRRTRL